MALGLEVATYRYNKDIWDVILKACGGQRFGPISLGAIFGEAEDLNVIDQEQKNWSANKNPS